MPGARKQTSTHHDDNNTTTAETAIMDSTTKKGSPASNIGEGLGGAAYDPTAEEEEAREENAERSVVARRTPAAPVPPPDGGWGWVVVLSSFVISVLVDGVCFSIGIFFTPLRDYYGSSKAQTAWVGSVLNGTYLSIGPIVAACVQKFGCRKMTVFGAVVAAVGFFASTFSTSMSQLIFTFGFVGGTGFGFMYLPAMVMVGYYFEKKRALATGIACCGSGIGSFMFAPFTNYLMDEYNWQGAFWIISGIVLNGVVFGVFYRPLELDTSGENTEEEEEEEEEEAEQQAEGEGEGEQEEAPPAEQQPLLEHGNGHAVGDRGVNGPRVTIDPPLSLNASERHSLIQDRDADGNKISPPRILMTGITIEVEPPVKNGNPAGAAALSPEKNGVPSHEGNGLPAEGDKVKRREPAQTSGSGAKPRRPFSDILLGATTTTITPHIPVNSKQKGANGAGGASNDTFRSCSGLTKKKEEDRPVNPLARLAYSHEAFSQLRSRKPHHSSTENQHHHQHHHHHGSHHHLDAASPLMRKDIFYSGSLRHLPEYQSSETLDEYRRKVMTVDVEEVVDEEGEENDEGDEEKGMAGGKKEEGEGEEGEGGRKRKSLLRRVIVGPLLHVFDISLLKSITFDIYGFSCFLCMLGFFVPFIYLPTLCLDLGMGTSKAAFLISIIGIANTVGRVGVGIISDRPWADCLLINNVALITGGVCTCFVPYFSGEYALFAGYTFVFGTSIAIFVSLRSIIMVELMGLQKLTNSFGLVIMFQGISTFIGAPIAGMISDVTGDYNVAFYLAGVLMAISGVICLPLRKIAYWENGRAQKREKEEKRMMEELEEKKRKMAEEEEKKKRKREDDGGERAKEGNEVVDAQRKRLVVVNGASPK